MTGGTRKCPELALELRVTHQLLAWSYRAAQYDDIIINAVFLGC